MAAVKDELPSVSAATPTKGKAGMGHDGVYRTENGAMLQLDESGLPLVQPYRGMQKSVLPKYARSRGR